MLNEHAWHVWMLCVCCGDVVAMLLRCRCDVVAMLWWYCCDVMAMLWRCCCDVVAMSLRCYGDVMVMLWWCSVTDRILFGHMSNVMWLSVNSSSDWWMFLLIKMKRFKIINGLISLNCNVVRLINVEGTCMTCLDVVCLLCWCRCDVMVILLRCSGDVVAM